MKYQVQIQCKLSINYFFILFRAYWPSKLPKIFIKTLLCSANIRTNDVISMCKRLSIRISANAYASFESDLAWIGYLQIATPMPSGFNRHTREV